MVFEKSLCLVPLIHSLYLPPFLSSKSLRGRSPKQGLINFKKSLCLVFPPSISVSFFKISARA